MEELSMAEVLPNGIVPHPLHRPVVEIAGVIIEDFQWHQRPVSGRG
jgi:hypothetical protein